MSKPVQPWLRGDTPTTPPAPGPGPRPRQSPSSQYTEAVAAGGLDALAQARAQRRYGMSGAQQNYQEQGVFSYNRPTARENDPYNEWLASMVPQQQQGPYAYGQTEEGNYAGFRTEGGLKAALKGRAETARAQDREVFGYLDSLAAQGLDELEQQYRTTLADSSRFIDDAAEASPWNTTWMDNITQRDRAEAGLGAAGAGEAFGDWAQGALPGERQRPMGMLSPEYQRALDSGDSAEVDAFRRTGVYQSTELDPWLGEASAPYLEQQDFAQAALATPITTYAQRAGAEYGVDPMLVAGWFPENMAIADARDQRTLDFLNQTGMTPADYEQALNELERQQTTAATDEAAAVEEANTQAIDQYGLEATGGITTTSELSQAVGLPPVEIISILDSDEFLTYSSQIAEALNTRNTDTIAETMMVVLDDAAFTDPALLNVLQTVYKDYIPPDYEFLGV